MGRSDDLAHLPRKRPLELSAGDGQRKESRPTPVFDEFSSEFLNRIRQSKSSLENSSLSNPSFTQAEADDVNPSVGSFKVMEPWDLLRGKCVFKQRSNLLESLSEARLRHFAPNCSTFSRAREIPRDR